MNRDLTKGNPEKVLWQFCLPLFCSVIFQQLYNIADSLVVGKFVGEDALAAVGNSYEITLIFIAFAVGSSMGVSIVVSQLFGAKDIKALKSAVSTSLIAIGALVAFLMASGLLFGRWLLEAINTPPEIFVSSQLYLDIYIFGLPFLFFYNISNGIFSGLGDSRTPFVFLAVSSVANILVDVLFVKTFGLGVAGVAWATFLCQGVSCLLSLLVLSRRLGKMVAEGRPELFSWTLFRSIAALAIPSIIQQSFVSLGNIMIQSVINTFGSGVIAGYAAAIKLNNLIITAFTTIGNGMSNYTGQNMGAGEDGRVREGWRSGVKIVWTLGLPFFLAYFFFGKEMLGFFLDSPSRDALSTGIIFLRIVAPFYFVISLKTVSDGMLRGYSLMKPFMYGTFADLIIRVAGAFLLSRTALGSVGIWCSWPFGWTTGTIISLYWMRRGPWYKEKA